MRTTKRPFIRDHAESAGEVDFFPCYIMGEPWRYGLVTQEQMKILGEEVSDNPSGLCDTNTSTIYFLKGSVTHTIAIHELTHVYFAETLTHSAKLSADQVEEVMCDIAAFNWFKIVLLARIMVHNMLCYEDYLEGKKEQDWEECPPDVVDSKLPENLLELVATYVTNGNVNPLLKATKTKKRTRAKPGPKK